MNAPRGLVYDSATNKLFVAQSGNHRVTVYNVTSTISNGQAAVNILGQPTFASTTATTTQAGINNPQGLAYDSTNKRLFVVQSANSRVSVFNVTSITDGQNAVDLLGQYDGTNLTDPQPLYTKAGVNDSPNRYGFNSPNGILLDAIHHRFFVADRSNNRVLVYNLNSDNTFPDRVPDNVLGQTTFNTNVAATTQAGMTTPVALAYDSVNDRLFVAQDSINRITVYDVSSITNGQNAINVLGQNNFVSSTSATTQAGMKVPTGLAYDTANSRLFVADSNNFRVLIYNVTTTITDGQNATNVLGQSNFTSSAFSISQSSVTGPSDVAYDNIHNRLFVSQSTSNRVTVFDVTNVTDGQNAVNILGQTDFISNTPTTTQSGMTSPAKIAYDSKYNRLFVAQYPNRRVTVFDVSSITDGQNAMNVLGQTDFISKVSTTTQSGMNTPYSMTYDSAHDRLFVDDFTNNRITVYDAAFAPGFTVVETAGSTTSTEGGATDAFTVVLNSQPVTNVVLTLSSSAPDSVTTSPSILTFTSSTWNIPQTIIVSAPEDSNTTNETATLTVAVTTAMSDSQYSSVASQMITVTITDNDTAGGGGGGVITYGGGGPGVVYGCTDKSALNYNPLAFLVDGSCRYTASAIPTTSTLNIPTTTPALPIVREGQLFCTTTPYLTKDIRYGGKNNPEDVRMLETFLNTYEAADLPVDGIYSQKDMAAVIKWQEKYAAEILAPWKLKKGTGIISVTSLKKIRQIYKSSCEAVSPSEFTLCIPETAVLKRGTRGEAVYAAQTILYRMSFLNTLPNGIFGPVTEAAVKLFQTSFGISRSGIVGTLTR
jgi:DNA-binding beta-propeller fold protein YncE